MHSNGIYVTDLVLECPSCEAIFKFSFRMMQKWNAIIAIWMPT